MEYRSPIENTCRAFSRLRTFRSLSRWLFVHMTGCYVLLSIQPRYAHRWNNTVEPLETVLSSASVGSAVDRQCYVAGVPVNPFGLNVYTFGISAVVERFRTHYEERKNHASIYDVLSPPARA